MHGLDELNLVRPSYYLEADELSEIQSNSLDFVIGNHILEHTDDPHSTLLEWFRVLRDKGILYLSIPNYRSNEYLGIKFTQIYYCKVINVYNMKDLGNKFNL